MELITLTEKFSPAYRNQRKIPVVFHNFKGYDGLFIMKSLYNWKSNTNINDSTTVLAKTSTGYMCIDKTFDEGWGFKFMDSFQFMRKSLSSLAKTVPNWKYPCNHDKFDTAYNMNGWIMNRS